MLRRNKVEDQSSEAEKNRLSERYREYLTQKNKQKRNVFTVQLSMLLLFFILWETAGRLKWIDVLLFSYPTKIVNHILGDIMSGEIWVHIVTTVGETVVGFLLGTLFGTALAILLWWSPFISKVLDPYMVVFNSMPKVALGPLFIVVFGAGYTAIVVTTLSVIVIITTLVVYNSFSEVDGNLVKVVHTFGGSRKDIFRKVIFPASFPAIISTLKVNVGLAWVGVIVGEFLVAQEGLGYLIIYGFQVFNFTLVMSSLLIIAVVATIMYQLVVYMERKILLHK
ncbi:ABC transporter permease [Paenibacillus crassostreae]|uniref:ABC transporter permease n=1 Tax=Paenibacillus crassostreae TaxID=1763538 RepID=A0A167DRK2_9BACL|nr:ABC transporter permease [Paenibacillus crassostreae]AOZ91143.1 ABC transporter permease [Paenibacillus crassostreae]OAB74698.1 ABC transporter permease [Paenibacillus crassostreae]